MESKQTPKTRGGAKPYRVGADYERYVKAKYEQAGWPVVVRSPKSGSPMDLTAIRAMSRIARLATPVVHLIQCKKAGYMTPGDREVLIALARKVDAEPIMAWDKPVRRKNLRTGRELGALT